MIKITSLINVLMLLCAGLLASCSSDESVSEKAASPSESTSVTTVVDTEISQSFQMGIEVTSPVFNRIRRIPKTHVCEGKTPRKGASFEQDATTKYAGRENASPPLQWTGIPDGTKSVALLMDSDQLAHEQDPDARFTHWLIWNIPSDSGGLTERVPTTTDVVSIGPEARQGKNDDNVIGYSGPCPIPTTVDYRQTKVKIVFEYVFTVYALDTVLDLAEGATRQEFINAIDGHILSGGIIKGEFVGSKQMN